MSNDDQDIRRKLEQIQQVVTILQAMDVRNLPYSQWLTGQAKKNHPLTGANQTELDLKQKEIAQLESSNDPSEAAILADEKAELAIMNDKMKLMLELKTALDAATGPQAAGDASLSQRVADLINAIGQDELKLKQQQVVTLTHRIGIRPRASQRDLQKLQKLKSGEQYEVKELKKISPLNQQIADGVRSGEDLATLTSLRRRVTHHELLMKLQNEKQLNARLKKG